MAEASHSKEIIQTNPNQFNTDDDSSNDGAAKSKHSLESNVKSNNMNENVNEMPQIDNYIDTIPLDTLIINRKLSMEKVVTDLSSLLINTDANRRAKGIEILSIIFLKIPNDYLSEKEVEHFATFFCDRLKDHYSVIPHALSGLLSISKSNNLHSDVTKLIFMTIIKEMSVQSHKVSERFLVYKLLSQLINRNSDGLRSLKADFIYGIIQIIEGERDPRCLLMVFQLVRHIIENFEIGHFAEDVFEVISCYFPITFTPPPNDEYGITKDDLQFALENCFKSSPDFASFCIPLLIEKLESNLSNAKIDSYRVLSECASIYGFAKIKPFVPSLWTCIRIDCLKPGDVTSNEIANSALNALTEISNTLSNDKSCYDSLIDDIWKDIEPAFCKPELGLMSASTEIINAFVNGNRYAYNRFTSESIPILLQQFTFNHVSAYRMQIIESISKICSHSKHLKLLETEEFSLKNFDSIFMTLTSIVVSENEHNDLKCAAINFLNELILSPQTLSQKQNEILSEILFSLMINPINNDELMLNVQMLLESFAVSNPSLTIDKIIKSLLNNLDMSYSSEIIQNRFYVTLSAFESVSSEFEIFKIIAPHLIERIKNNFMVNSDFDESCSVSFAKCLEKCLSKHNQIMEKKPYIFNKCLDPLIQHCVHSALCTDGNQHFRGSDAHLNEKLLDIIYEMIAKGVRHLTEEENNKLFHGLSSFIVNGNVEKFLYVVPPSCYCKFSSGPELLKCLSERQIMLIIRLANSIFCNLNLNFDLSEINCLIDKMIHHAIDVNYENKRINEYAAQTVASLINKINITNIKLNQYIGKINEIEDDAQSEERKLRLLKLCIWITKGLVMRKHEYRAEFIAILLKALTNESMEINTEAVSAFSIIHREDYLLLTPESHANVKFLFHQCFYMETFDRLLFGYTQNMHNDLSRSKLYASSLLTQLKYLPKSVFKNELSKLLPMLLDTLNDTEQTDNQLISISSLCQILTDGGASILQPHLDSLVSRCIILSLKCAYLQIRSLSLDCLTLISSSYDESTLCTLRSNVIRNAKLALNDKKRIVRKSAVKTHCKWILIGQPH